MRPEHQLAVMLPCAAVMCGHSYTSYAYTRTERILLAWVPDSCKIRYSLAG